MLRSPEFTVVRLSEPVPHHAFAWRWGRPGAMRDLTRARRRELLCLTAASGATANLQVAARAVGFKPTREVAHAAGKAGQLGSILMLEELGCDVHDAVKGAAAGGHLVLCGELLQQRAGDSSPYDAFDCACEAADGGHVDVVDFMVRRLQIVGLAGSGLESSLMAHIAGGCELAALQRYYRELVPEVFNNARAFDWEKERILGCAASSPTPDWRAKVEWLEAQGFPRVSGVFYGVVERPDAMERLVWLEQRGYTCDPVYTLGAGIGGNADVVLLLAERQAEDDDDEDADPYTDVASEAAACGHLHVLQVLHAAELVFSPGYVIRAAASRGHLHMVAWLFETLGVQLDEELFEGAAGSGSVQLMAWLRERGCPWDSRAVTAAARSGCVAALEWLAERGCPMPDDGLPYFEAGKSADLATVECLRRLGCPWGPPGLVLGACISGGLPGCPYNNCASGVLPVLSWLLAAGCPVDWPGAVAAAEAECSRVSDGAGHSPSELRDRRRVLAWLHFQASRLQV
ncbi:hypothetical protein GPECTOR_56g355 [Gonium pectorale]|uniref:Ankyrin repeat domain-containing protein n=1 Tax=Gonium pectorale TaxID=33097 RepID=A0A150G5U9_GONPE|nr:hypothetical protein GPECTOR_56g355 [Gonium pectorale]|eukprot:KXZ45259.1 hypothetical protein GPECTOR_56g355 [Gonium pectorale]